MDGCIEGNINSGLVIIGEKVVINGEIRVKEVMIWGCVIGFICVYKVVLFSIFYVEGDILYNVLVVEFGVFFDGNCWYVDDFLSVELLGKGCGLVKNEIGL